MKLKHSLKVNKDSTIKEAMRMIDKNGLGIVFIVDENDKFFGLVTDGDIRRAILKGKSITRPVGEIANRSPVVVSEKEPLKFAVSGRIMPLDSSLKIPVVGDDEKIKDVLFIHTDDRFLLSQKVNYNKESTNKVLILGGAGYLGSVLCRQLLDKGYKVRVLDNLTRGKSGIKDLYGDTNFEFLKGDIRNISDVIKGIDGVDSVIHLAAVVGDPACAKDPKKTIEINYLATKAIAEACKYFQINRFIFASTCSVYGQSATPDQQLTEKSKLNPVSLYAETKIKCEQSILETMDENFSPTILRMATLYGYSPCMRFDLAVNFLTLQAIKKKKITIFGGKQWRPWLHLEDAAQAFISCLEGTREKVRGETFNVLSENHRVIEIGKIIKSVCPETELTVSKKITDKRSYNVSFDKISRLLKYNPKKKIADGVIEIKRSAEIK